MDPTVAETATVPEKLQNGHKKKKKTNKNSSANSNQIVNNSSDNNNHCSLTEIDEVSLQIDNCHIKENGLHENENGVATTTSKKKKKNKNKKPSPNVASDVAAVDANVANGPTTEALTMKDSTLDQPEPTTSRHPIKSTDPSPPLPAPTEVDVPTTNEATSAEQSEPKEKIEINYIQYETEEHMPDIMRVIQKDLSEPYSIYTYRYFIHNWPNLCFLALHETKCVGAIVCKFDMHREIRRGYIAMLAVDKDYRKLKIGTTLVQKAIKVMVDLNADEVVLETEITNKPALRLYENLGFVRDKRLFYYYLNGVDALRLKLWFR